MSEQFREAIITTPPLYLISEDGMRGEKIVDANVTEWPDIHVGVAAIDDTPKPKTRAAAWAKSSFPGSRPSVIAGKDAAAVIALGSCAVWGGMPSAKPNPTWCVGVSEVWKKPVVNIPGCPPNPYNFLSTLVHYITYGWMPELDNRGRPKFAYSRLIHENCERRPHFDSGRFAQEFGDAGHEPLKLRTGGEDLDIELPAKPLDPIATVLVLETSQ